MWAEEMRKENERTEVDSNVATWRMISESSPEHAADYLLIVYSKPLKQRSKEIIQLSLILIAAI